MKNEARTVVLCNSGDDTGDGRAAFDCQREKPERCALWWRGRLDSSGNAALAGKRQRAVLRQGLPQWQLAKACDQGLIERNERVRRFCDLKVHVALLS